MGKKSLQIVPENPTRREFLSDVAVATGLGVASVCGLGCQASSTWTNHHLVVAVESQAQLLKVDTAMYPQLASRGGQLPMADVSNGLRVLLVHTLAGEFLAFNMSCTHKGADVELTEDKTGLVCPLHNSLFSMDGKRLSGPARRHLKMFEVEQSGSVLSINLGSLSA